MITKSLEWPSLTVQWLPSKDIPADSEFSVQKLILGTHTSDQEPNYLMIAKVRLPIPIEKNSLEEEKSHYKVPQEKKIEFEVQIIHEGEVNKAKHCPQENQLIATKTISGEVHVFNYFKHPSKPIDNKPAPDMRLQGHTKEGYGLSWNPNQKGYVVSSGDDHLICIWDITGQSNGVVQPLIKYTQHQNVVGEVCWHKFHPYIFGSVDDDRNFALWDIRKDRPLSMKEAHKGEIYCIDFNPLNEFLFATGSKDKTACIWDMRNITQPIGVIDYCHDEINCLQWSPFDSSVLATSSHNKLLYIWNISNLGQKPNANGVPPELLFVHGGHTSKISDFSWNCNDYLTIASVAEDNILQIWQMETEIYVNSQKLKST